MDAISFELKSNFGFFHWGKTKGDRRITSLFISRTEVLGIVGAIIGLDGYTQENFRNKIKPKQPRRDTYYDILKGLEVSIVPINVPHFFDDQLIHREMKHINTKGSLMVEMKGLVEPHYKVYLRQGTVEDDVFEKICLYVKKGWSEFIPYFGKNQFPLEILSPQEEELVEQPSESEVLVKSLFRQEDVSKPQKVRKSKLVKTSEDNYHLSDTLKNYDKENPARIVGEQMIWSSFDVSLSVPVYQTKTGEHIVFQ